MPTKAEMSKIVAWVVGILTVIIGYMWMTMRDDVNTLREHQVEIRIDNAKQNETLEKQNDLLNKILAKLGDKLED